MKSPYIWYPDNFAETSIRDNIGGKSVQLLRIARSSFPIPRWFCVTTQTLQDFLDQNGIIPPVGILDLAEVKKVQEQIISAPLPNLIRENILSAAVNLFKNSESGALVTRSSATVEDGQFMAFAGLFETFCGIIDTDMLLSRIKSCWASLWSARVSKYLNGRRLIDKLSMAVIVQEFIPAKISGVMFTANPVNSRINELIIEASWGLGELIVGGEITPDHFVISRSGIASEIIVTSFRSGSKRKALIWNPAENKIELIFPSIEQQKAPSISEKEIFQLAKMGLLLEADFGCPQDVEWSIYNGQIYLLQARPITTLHGHN